LGSGAACGGVYTFAVGVQAQDKIKAAAKETRLFSGVFANRGFTLINANSLKNRILGRYARCREISFSKSLQNDCLFLHKMLN
jgi:N-acetylglutamate synthase-like GNAT family acetyltransferase